MFEEQNFCGFRDFAIIRKSFLQSNIILYSW